MTAFERTEATPSSSSINAEHRTAIGTVTEAHVLRTYRDELERRNQEAVFR